MAKKRRATPAIKRRTIAAIDDIMREDRIPRGGARFENSKGQRVAKQDLVDNQGRLKSGRIVPRGAAAGDEAAVVSFSGGMFH